MEKGGGRAMHGWRGWKHGDQEIERIHVSPAKWVNVQITNGKGGKKILNLKIFQSNSVQCNIVTKLMFPIMGD